ncbi:MAG: hypothetical protein IPK68_11910 [Bdellovibrionales bacterium]|nr:hypothetical protein [Bdellovibrionales bacterium]
MKRIYSTSIKDKESFKWIEALQQTSALTPEGSTVITIGDREADIFEFLQAAEALKQSLLFGIDRTGNSSIPKEKNEIKH